MWKNKHSFARPARGRRLGRDLRTVRCGRPVSCNVFSIVQGFGFITFFFPIEIWLHMFVPTHLVIFTRVYVMNTLSAPAHLSRTRTPAPVFRCHLPAGIWSRLCLSVQESGRDEDRGCGGPRSPTTPRPDPDAGGVTFF